jgi:hypothetical protein
MLVSQYIYTACGKERTGAFSVFSKSKDITNEESAEIREVMMYKTPSGLPYEPTEKEIEELFPKKFGYFFLSSGRACLAQVCYVGRVYSDLDGRFGNYIIHAFVFEKTDDFVPYSFIENLLFKRKLTRKEWHDDPIPDELPQIEIPDNGGMLSMNEVNSFLNEDRKNKLKLLIEAIVNSSSENTVCYNDEHKNHKYWLKILSVCLPKTMQNAVSFCTHFTNTLIPGNISSRIQIKINQPENSMYNYAMEAQKGRYAFNFLNDIISESVKPGKYAENVVISLSSGIFEAVKFVDNVNKIMSTYPVNNINEASDLINIYNADYSKFRGIDEIFNAILIADRVNYEKRSIADNIWTKKPQVNFNNKQRLRVLAFIYENISVINVRIGIIKTVIDNAEQLGLQADGANAFSKEISSKANFIFANYLDYLKVEGLANYITRNQNSFFKLFLAFDFLTNLPVVKSLYQTHNYTASEEIQAVKLIMTMVFKRQSVYDLDLLINSANSSISGLGVELLNFIIQDELKSGSNITNVQFAFSILQQLRSRTDFSFNYLFLLIKIMSEKEGFVKAYINAQNNDKDFFKRFENENKNNSLIMNFCRKRDIFCFTNQPLTINILTEYFNKYYIIGEDTELFTKRLSDYFSTVQSEKKANECINILNIMKLPVNADKSLLLPLYRVVLEAVFSIPYDKIFDLCQKKEWFDRINEYFNVITNAKGGLGGLNMETRELISITLCGKILEKYGSRSNNQQVHSFFSKTQADKDKVALYLDSVNSEKSINTFITYYFYLVANILIIGATGAKLFNYEGILEKVFGKIIEKGNLEKLTDDILYEMNKIKTNTIVFILYILRKRLMSSPNLLDKKLGDIANNYFEKLSSGDRKKKFSELATLAEQNEIVQFERYFDEFNKTHKSRFFDFLKNKN